MTARITQDTDPPGPPAPPDDRRDREGSAARADRPRDDEDPCVVLPGRGAPARDDPAATRPKAVIDRVRDWFVVPSHTAAPDTDSRPVPPGGQRTSAARSSADDFGVADAPGDSWLSPGGDPDFDADPPLGEPWPALVAEAPLRSETEPPMSAAWGEPWAAVLGRPGEVEPVAAALALVLRRAAGAKAATVAVVGAVPPAVVHGGGGGPARRLAARLDGLGFEAHARGKLAWAALDPGDPRLPAALEHLELAASPLVVAIASPRTEAVDGTLAGFGSARPGAAATRLLVVAADPAGPLARLAAEGLPAPAVIVPPLARGLGRALARAGVRAPRSLQRTLAHAGMGAPSSRGWTFARGGARVPSSSRRALAQGERERR